MTLFLSSLTVQFFTAILPTIGLIIARPVQEGKIVCKLPRVSRRDRVFFHRRLLAVLLALVLAVPSLLAGFPGGQAARADNTPSITIASPANPSGPVQTGIRLTGANWTANDTVQVFYNAPGNTTNLPCGDPNNPQALAQSQSIPGGTKTVQGDGTWTLDFQWPSTSGVGSFYLCAFDTTMTTGVAISGQPFKVLSTALPAINLDNTSPNVGDKITVSGAGFLPGNFPVDLTLAPQGSQTQGVLLGTATADGNGNFTQPVTLPLTPSGNLSVVASTRAAVKGAPAPLVASQDVTVGATASTPTPGPTPTPTPDPTATTAPTTATGAGGASSSSGSGLILGLLVALLALVLVAIAGVLIWYFSGTRPPAGAGAPGTPPVPARARAPVAPRRAQSGRPPPAQWSDDEWEAQQAPWEEDEQGGWGSGTSEWDQGVNPWPTPDGQNQPDPGFPPRGPTGRRNTGSQRPSPPRAPNRDDWAGRSRPGQDDW